MEKEELIAQFEAAQAAHAAWKVRLKSAIQMGRIEQKVEDIARCDLCAFGKWLSGNDLPPDIKATRPFIVTYGLHREFHKAAARVAEKALQGDKVAAEQEMAGDYTKWSSLLSKAIVKWQTETMLKN